LTERATAEQGAVASTTAGARDAPAARSRWWGGWLAPAFVTVAVLASVLLAAMLFFVHRAIGDASLVLARGEGAQFAEAVHEALRTGPRPPQAATLESVLARKQAQGLRYVALLRPDGGAVEVQAGEPAEPLTPAVLASLRSMEPTRVGGWMRISTGPPAGPPPERWGAAPGHPPPAPPGHGGPDDAHWSDGRPPPPPRRDGPPPRLVLEFEPVAARQLLVLARRTLVAGVVAVPAFALCAALLGYLVRQRGRLLQRLEHERRLAALGEMSAVLAHEIRNPLASLKGHAQLLARSLEGDEARVAKAELVVREAVRLQDLATDLLDFAGAGTVERVECDPAALLRESADAVDAARVELDLASAPATWPLDPGRVRQALVNVLRNAVQASPPERAVEAAVRAEGERLVFEVRDHGPGIARGDEERIFEPFHTRKVRGTGLGLAITRRIVEQQSGHIVAANAPDGGAVFRISIARR